MGWPTWTSDPNKLVYVKENAGRGVQRIEEVDRTTGERKLVVEDAASPAASPNAAELDRMSDPVRYPEHGVESRPDIRCQN